MNKKIYFLAQVLFFHGVVFSMELTRNQHADIIDGIVKKHEKSLYFKLCEAVSKFSEVPGDQKNAEFENLKREFPGSFYIDLEGNRVVKYSELYEGILL